jgi:hypothetical protein
MAWAHVWITPLRAETIHFREGPARCSVTIVADPPVGEWKQDQIGAGGVTPSSGGYRLALRRADRAGNAQWTVKLTREDQKRFQVTQYSYECRVSLGRVAAVFDTQVPEGPSLFRQPPQIDVVLEVRPNRGLPFLMACDHYGHNSLATGPIDQTGTYRITGRRDGDDYAVTIARDEYGQEWFTGAELTDAMYVSTKSDFWFNAARGYADAVDAAAGYEPRPIPDAAWRPYYSTWYAFSEDIDEKTVWENARIAADLGIGNFLIFIGWSTCQNWFSDQNAWGDYTACERRFPDFARLVDRIQKDLGMAVQVWVAPTWIGATSKSFDRMGDYRSKWPEGGYDRNLDPRSPQAREHIRERFAFLAREQGVEGFWVDFLDTVYNRNDATHEKNPDHFGAALEQFMAACYEGFASEHPAPLVEYRLPFANLLSKRHASVFGTTYTNENWDRNRLLAIARKPFSHGVATRCDPLVWTAAQFDHRDFVGKTLSAVMFCGPPGLSMDLTQLDENRRRNLRDWFALYNKHRENLTRGEFRPFGSEFHYPEMMISRGHTAYAWVSRWETGHIPFPDGTKHAFIFTNLPEEPSFIARLDITHVTGMVPGRYRARWFNSVLESHDPPFEITIKQRSTASRQDSGSEQRPPLLSPRENWDFHPDDERPSLDVRRGGYLELELIE